MKKFTTIFTVIIATVFVAKAQNASSGFTLGVQAGLVSGKANVSADVGTGSALDLGGTSLTGFKFGLTGNLNLSDKISFMPELNYISKGTKTNLNLLGIASLKSTIKTNFLEVPLNIAYKIGDNEKGFFVGAGPVLSFGLGGTYTSQLDNDPVETGKVTFSGKKDSEVAAGDTDIHLKSLEVGANIFVGYTFAQKFSAKLNYNQAFTNLNPNTDSKFTTNYFSLGLVYSLF